MRGSFELLFVLLIWICLVGNGAFFCRGHNAVLKNVMELIGPSHADSLQKEHRGPMAAL
jgi:hypothetical protein